MSKTSQIPIHLQQNRENELEGHVALIYGPSMVHVWSMYGPCIPRTPQKCLFFANVFTLRSNLFSEGGAEDFPLFSSRRRIRAIPHGPPPAPTSWLPQNPRPPPRAPPERGEGAEQGGGVIAGGADLDPHLKI